MSSVDDLQDAEEAVAQQREEREARALASRREDLRRDPVKETADRPHRIEMIPLSHLHTIHNVRSEIGDVHQLAISIRERGLLTALTVRQRSECEYEVVAGARRYEALRSVHHENLDHEVRCDVIDGLTDEEVDELMLLENVQREELPEIDEARGLRRILHRNPDMSAAALARSLGLTPAWVRSRLRLLDLPESVQQKLSDGDLSFTAAQLLHSGRARGTVTDDEVEELAEAVAADEMSTKDLRERVRPASSQPPETPEGYEEISQRLDEARWSQGRGEQMETANERFGDAEEADFHETDETPVIRMPGALGPPRTDGTPADAGPDATFSDADEQQPLYESDSVALLQYGDEVIAQVCDTVRVVLFSHQGEVLLVREQLRGAARSSWQLPGGRMNPENRISSAQEALRERTGFEAHNWVDLGSYVHPSEWARQRVRIFVAADPASDAGADGVAQRWFSFTDALDIAQTGQLPETQLAGLLAAGRAYGHQV